MRDFSTLEIKLIIVECKAQSMQSIPRLPKTPFRYTQASSMPRRRCNPAAVSQAQRHRRCCDPRLWVPKSQTPTPWFSLHRTHRSNPCSLAAATSPPPVFSRHPATTTPQPSQRLSPSGSLELYRSLSLALMTGGRERMKKMREGDQKREKKYKIR